MATITKAKPVFYCVLRGLRGGYMPDDARHEAVRTFEQFAESIRYEVDFFELAWNCDDIDNETQIDKLLREAWEHVQHGALERCVATGARWDEEGRDFERDSSYGLTVSGSCARDYAEYRRAMRDA